MGDTILDKSFIYTILNEIPIMQSYDTYDEYLRTSAINMLNATLLSYIIEGGGSNQTVFLLYKFEEKYILIEICEGACSGCKSPNLMYNEIISHAIQNCYITLCRKDAEIYYLKRLKAVDSETEYRYRSLYNILTL